MISVYLQVPIWHFSSGAQNSAEGLLDKFRNDTVKTWLFVIKLVILPCKVKDGGKCLPKPNGRIQGETRIQREVST